MVMESGGNSPGSACGAIHGKTRNSGEDGNKQRRKTGGEPKVAIMSTKTLQIF